MSRKHALHLLLTLPFIFSTESYAREFSLEPIRKGAFWTGTSFDSRKPQLAHHDYEYLARRFPGEDRWLFGWMGNSWSLPGVAGMDIANYANGYSVFDTSSVSGDISSATLSFRMSKPGDLALRFPDLFEVGQFGTSINLFDVTTDLPDFVSNLSFPTDAELGEFLGMDVADFDGWLPGVANRFNTARFEPYFQDLESGESYGSLRLRMDEYVDELVSIELSDAAIAALNDATETFAIGSVSPRIFSDPFEDIISGHIYAADIQLSVTTRSNGAEAIPEPSSLLVFSCLVGLAAATTSFSFARDA